jgi:chromosome segregation ATPase
VPTHRARESKTYFIQNNSDEDRAFTVDHVVRKEYRRLDKGGDQVGPAVYRFQIKVAAKKTGLQEVVEERTHRDRSQALNKASDEALRVYLASPAVSTKVKAALQKFFELRDAAAETRRQLDEQRDQLKVLTEDQARLRENLKIIPPTADPYKGFLQKFVAQEAEIDGHQKQIRQLEAALSKQQRAFETYVNGLTVE